MNRPASFPSRISSSCPSVFSLAPTSFPRYSRRKGHLPIRAHVAHAPATVVSFNAIDGRTTFIGTLAERGL